MIVPGSASALLLRTADTGYKVERSLRFNSSDSAFCSRVFSSAGNRKTFTYSAWVKRNKLGVYGRLLAAGTGTSDATYFALNFRNSDIISVEGVGTSWRLTTQVFRDPGAWMHVLLAIDTTLAVAGNRIKLYINGSQVTTFSASNDPTQNYDFVVNSNVEHMLGADKYNNSYSYYSDFQLADVHFIDGQALTPSSFTEVSATTGQLIPKAYTGSFGTNGFKLDFADNSAATAAALGADSSGNGNHWTPNNLSINTGGPTSVAAASGALPIYNTTDTYGATKGTGTRTDSNSSSIVLAIPMDGANNGTTFTDESATIKGSGSAKTITRNGDAKTSTAQSKYYGSSGYFDGNGDYLQLANSSDLDCGTENFTCEMWVRSDSSSGSLLHGVNPINEIAFASGALIFGRSGSFAATLGSNVATGVWQHIAVVRNGSTITGYVNGIAGSTPYSIGANSVSFTTGTGTLVARNHLSAGTASYFSGYIQDFRVYKGVAKYTANFNPPSSTQNGTVGAGCDSLVDTPTSYGTDIGAGGEVRGNYCTGNPLAKNTYGSTLSFANGNLDWTYSGNAFATIAATSGKWYAEVVFTTAGGAGRGVGVAPYDWSSIAAAYFSDGTKYLDNVASSYSGVSFTTGDVIGIAWNADSKQVTFYKNNASQGAMTYTNTKELTFVAFRGGVEGTSVCTWNFGQRPFAYTAPSGFKALCDTNLPAPVVAKPNTVMDVKLYTGNGSTQTISGLGFSPDLVWVKGRNAGWWHTLTDTVRGGSAWLHSNVTNAEATNGLITGFTSDGFTLSASPNGTVNQNNDTYVAWCWDAGSSTVTNTQGSITSQVRANASAGFSVVTYTGNGVNNSSVGHGLGAAPRFVILKNRTDAIDWIVYTTVVDGSLDYLFLNTTAAKGDALESLPSSSLFYVPGNTYAGANGKNYVAYCFAPVAGYSSFGSYTGNGSSDGPFVFTGMRPRWILFKPANAVANWAIHDTSRSPYNAATSFLFPNSSEAEVTSAASYSCDILSNGFKPRNTGGSNEMNVNNNTYIYAAFAESPFQYARAR